MVKYYDYLQSAACVHVISELSDIEKLALFAADNGRLMLSIPEMANAVFPAVRVTLWAGVVAAATVMLNSTMFGRMEESKIYSDDKSALRYVQMQTKV